MIFPILSWTSWTGIILPGRLTNTSMPSRLASAHLWWWHPTQIHRIQALLYTFKWFLEGIHSSRQRDIQRMPLDFQDIQFATQQRKGKKTRSLKHSGLSAVLHSYLLSLFVDSLFFVCLHHSIPLMFLQYLLWTSLGQLSASVCFWPYIHCCFSWRTSRTMAYTGCPQHLLRPTWPILLAHTYHLMIQPRHHIFPGRPGWSQLLQPSTLFSSRSSATLLLLDLMSSGSLNKQQKAEKLGSQWKLFWKTCTSRGTMLQYVLQPTIGADTTTYPSPHPLPLRQHLLRFSHILNIPT